MEASKVIVGALVHMNSNNVHNDCYRLLKTLTVNEQFVACCQEHVNMDITGTCTLYSSSVMKTIDAHKQL